ncbi:hypothetical protein ACJX0J_026972 [Zea mays]
MIGPTVAVAVAPLTKMKKKKKLLTLLFADLINEMKHEVPSLAVNDVFSISHNIYLNYCFYGYRGQDGWMDGWINHFSAAAADIIFVRIYGHMYGESYHFHYFNLTSIWQAT